MNLQGKLVPVAELSLGDRATMLAVMDRHYANVVPGAFERDLSEKQWVIQVVDEAGKLRGFSTQVVLDVCVDGRPVKALFSGDTIIDREYWGDQSLMYVGGKLAVSLIEEYPDAELYWFLISAGYKTYRFLPVFFREFFPRYDVPTPADMQRVIDCLALAKFNGRYEHGVIRADTSQYYLRSGVADLSDTRLRDPHVQFFSDHNPGYVAGDELCCIARLARENFTEAARRVLRKA